MGGAWWVENYINAGLGILLVAHIFWVIASITLHELAHGWAAIWQGDRTPIVTGHMTANPIVHMGWMSLLLFALCGIAWGLMPVDPSRFRSRYGDLYVSAAGPLMNIALAAVCAVAGAIWSVTIDEGSGLYQNGYEFFYVGCALNILLAVFNLLPIPPLDGSHILASLSYKAREFFSNPQAAMFGTFIFLAIFFMTPVGGMLWGACFAIADRAINALASPLV